MLRPQRPFVILPGIDKPPHLASLIPLFSPMSTPAPGKPVYNVKNPCIARVTTAYDLSGPGAPKNTRHYEIDLTGSGSRL